jgi:hypothetical protein
MDTRNYTWQEIDESFYSAKRSKPSRVKQLRGIQTKIHDLMDEFKIQPRMSNPDMYPVKLPDNLTY